MHSECLFFLAKGSVLCEGQQVATKSGGTQNSQYYKKLSLLPFESQISLSWNLNKQTCLSPYNHFYILQIRTQLSLGSNYTSSQADQSKQGF